MTEQTLTEYLQSILCKPKPKPKNLGISKEAVTKLINIFIIPGLNELLIQYGLDKILAEYGIRDFPLEFKVDQVKPEEDYINLKFSTKDSNGFIIVDFPHDLEDLFRQSIKLYFKESGFKNIGITIYFTVSGVEISLCDVIGQLVSKNEQ